MKGATASTDRQGQDSRTRTLPRPRYGSRLVVLFLVLLSGGAVPTPVLAQAGRDRPGATEMLQALDLVREGRCDAAIPLLHRAADAGGLRNALWNLGQCYEIVNRPRNAIEAYQRYADDPRTNEEDRALAAQAIARLEATLATLDVSANVEGAQVEVDGQLSGMTPASVETNFGPHVVQVSSPGFRLWRQEVQRKGYLPWNAPVEIRDEATTQVEIELARRRLHPAWFWSLFALSSSCLAGVGLLTLPAELGARSSLEEASKNLAGDAYVHPLDRRVIRAEALHDWKLERSLYLANWVLLSVTLAAAVAATWVGLLTSFRHQRSVHRLRVTRHAGPVDQALARETAARPPRRRAGGVHPPAARALPLLGGLR